MDFVDQEEDQDLGLDQGSGDAGYGYPALNRALLAGFVPGAAGPGRSQTGAQAGATQPIGERIVDMTAQQRGASRIPQQEKVSDAAPPLLRLIDVRRPMAALDGLMPAKSPEPLLADGNTDSPVANGAPDANAAALASAAWSFDGGAQKGPEFGKPGDAPAFYQEDAGNGPEQSSNGPTDAESTTSPVTETAAPIGDEALLSATNAVPAVSAPPVPPARKAQGAPVQPLQVPQLTGSVGGQGAANKPEDVKAVQRLLNLAVKNGEGLFGEYKALSRFGTIAEDGKVSDKMLVMLGAFQHSKGNVVLDPGSPAGRQTLRALAQNQLADPRWSQYDETIRREVEYYNNFFSKSPERFPGFVPLDWRLVKAMLWEEGGGPDSYAWKWKNRPMAIGNRGDLGLVALRRRTDHTDLFVPQELREKIARQVPTDDLNVRAGIAYFYSRAIEPHLKTIIDDPAIMRDGLRPGENPTQFARRVGTTLEQLMKDNGLDARKAKDLRADQVLVYRKAHEVPVWRDWMDASQIYNVGNPAYRQRVQANYATIKRGWTQ